MRKEAMRHNAGSSLQEAESSLQEAESSLQEAEFSLQDAGFSLRNAGFSLIEILVVITIIGLLIGLSTGAYSTWITRGEEAKTQSLIEELKVYAQTYEQETGGFPPSNLSALGVNSTGDSSNEGIEAFVLSLYRKDLTRNLRPASESDLVNVDNDQADKNISVFGSAALLEFVDAWNNPIIYINWRDYSETFSYLVESPDTDREAIDVHALKNSMTGTYFNFDSYQIISVGPDGIFDTEDDLANFKR